MATTSDIKPAVSELPPGQLKWLWQTGAVDNTWGKLSVNNFMLLPEKKDIRKYIEALRNGKAHELKPENTSQRWEYLPVVLSGSCIKKSEARAIGPCTEQWERLLEDEPHWFPQKITYQAIPNVRLKKRKDIEYDFRIEDGYLRILLDFSRAPPIQPYGMMQKAYHVCGQHGYPPPEYCYIDAAHVTHTGLKSPLNEYRDLLRELYEVGQAVLKQPKQNPGSSDAKHDRVKETIGTSDNDLANSLAEPEHSSNYPEDEDDGRKRGQGSGGLGAPGPSGGNKGKGKGTGVERGRGRGRGEVGGHSEASRDKEGEGTQKFHQSERITGSKSKPGNSGS
ncbi:hypothetical protein BV20DRAFT_977676 [Pilatotrama ljubarskyi]|nr:hypothetical protein BV20DRAFT_977676 [Pilatotrama ljubarskyi]